jgi:hypothetical protein
MNNETPTKYICLKGFNVYSSVIARSCFRVTEQETALQSEIIHSGKRSLRQAQRPVKIIYSSFPELVEGNAPCRRERQPLDG